MRDDVLRAVLNDTRVDMVACKDATQMQVYTFFYALKWKHFKAFYSTVSLDMLENTNVELAVYNFAVSNKLAIQLVPRLWVLGNIAGSGYDLY